MAPDSIIKDHQLWIGFVQPEGLVVSPAALKNAQAVLSRNVGVQQEILRRHAVPACRTRRPPAPGEECGARQTRSSPSRCLVRNRGDTTTQPARIVTLADALRRSGSGEG